MFRIDGGGLSRRRAPRVWQRRRCRGGEVRLPLRPGGRDARHLGPVIVKFASPAPAPAKGQSEDSIARYIRQADGPLRQGQEEFNKRQWARAKEEAEKALNFDPANVDAARLKSQASRAEGDEVKFKRGMSELDKGSQESLGTALSTFYALSLDSSYRNEFAERLTSSSTRAASTCASGACSASARRCSATRTGSRRRRRSPAAVHPHDALRGRKAT